MTRIFEALKKSRVARPPAHLPAPPVQPLHGRTAAAGASPLRVPGDMGLRVHRVEGGRDLPEDVVREMTALRMTLETSLAPNSARSVLFMSAQRGEGTSTVAAQFAVTLARDAQTRVLLLDLSARRPSPFVEEAAGGGAGETALVQPIHGSGRLDVVPVPASAREAGIVAAPTAREWIETLSPGYDWIVLDGPAVIESPDAPPLAAVADGVVIVVEAGRTKRPVLHRATDLLRKSRANLIGTVLNRRRLEIPEFLYRRI